MSHVEVKKCPCHMSKLQNVHVTCRSYKMPMSHVEVKKCPCRMSKLQNAHVACRSYKMPMLQLSVAKKKPCHAVRPFVPLLKENRFYVTLLDDNSYFYYHKFILAEFCELS